LQFLSSNQYICLDLNAALQALLSMELYVDKSQVELYASKSSIDIIDLFDKNQKNFYINESLISTEFNVMDDPINPMTIYKKILYIVAGIAILGGVIYIGYTFFFFTPPGVHFCEKVDVLLYNPSDPTNILLSSPSYYTHIIEHNLALYDLSLMPSESLQFTVATLAASVDGASNYWYYLPV
jgi:hypothetical protein